MLIIDINNSHFKIKSEDNQTFVNEKSPKVDIVPLGNDAFSLIINGKSFEGKIESIDKANKTMILGINGKSLEVSISEPIDQLIQSMGIDLKAGKKAGSLKSPMPGMILKLLVSPGQQVQKGDNLLILEAMKMENMLKASAAGTVKTIHVAEKTAVEKGVVLIDFE